ncbi:MAG: M24 family metallopeptidase [Clostridiales Family XIII bacterium]|jgi:Xaa-Pro aminopeptidase|nr:M24 family metallopeptidase [Clostridiales Family XIII bacterium]
MKYDRYAPNLTITSKAEFVRRRETVQAKMQEQGVDCILLYGSYLRQGGAIRYFVDFPTGGTNALYAILPKEGEIALFGHGNKGAKAVPPGIAGDAEINFAYPYAAIAGFTLPALMEEVARYCKKHGFRVAGLYRTGMTPYDFVKAATEANPGTELVGVDDVIDRIMAVKSPEEIEICKYVARIHDDIYSCVRALVKPGQREKDLRNKITYICNDLDCESLNIMIGSGNPMAKHKGDSAQNRMLQDGDYVDLLLEISTVGGYWGEISRIISLGEPDPEIVHLNDLTIEIQTQLADAARPGVPAKRMLEMLHEFQAAHDCKPETRFFGHGQGLDLTQRPMFIEDETMVFEENMFVAIHPDMDNGHMRAFTTDNFLITKDGGIRLNKFPHGIIVID